jgi:hypothetical protein
MRRVVSVRDMTTKTDLGAERLTANSCEPERRLDGLHC